MTLTDVDSGTTSTRITDGMEITCFEGLEPGEYTVVRR